MQTGRIEDMTQGWFVGDFVPAMYRTAACEVAIKHYRQGEREALHHHRFVTEITAVVQGRVRLCGREWQAGDIVVLQPGEATDFEALTDAVNVVVKVPGLPNDKVPGCGPAPVGPQR